MPRSADNIRATAGSMASFSVKRLGRSGSPAETGPRYSCSTMEPSGPGAMIVMEPPLLRNTPRNPVSPIGCSVSTSPMIRRPAPSWRFHVTA